MMNKNMMQQAQKLQQQLLKAQEELATLNVEASSGGGAVTVVMNGQMQIQSVKISKDVINPEEVEMLEDLVLSAVKEAQAKAQEAAAKKMGALTGGMKIPGLM
jgi:DNA-binding YbaB/EbfC family protein